MAEFFYDETSDKIWLLEINPRISREHADLFEKVHGIAHHSIMLDLALNREPKPLTKNGLFNVAARFMMRTYEDGLVLRIPDAEAIAELHRRQPETKIKINAKAGQYLNDIELQDMYSFALVNLDIGGEDRQDMFRKYDEAVDLLSFDIDTSAV